MDRVKEQSIHQFHKTFSSSISKFLPCNEEKAVEKRFKKRMHIVRCSCCSIGLLCGIHCLTIFICDYLSQFNDGAN